MKKFDRAIQDLKADLLFEASSRFMQVKDVNEKFDFKKDSNGNSVCVFKTMRDQNEITVTAFCNKTKVDKFVLQKEDGTTEEKTEKEFAGDYWKDYDEFKNALKNYEKLKDKEIEGGFPNDTAKVNAFQDVLNSDDPSKLIKTYEIKDSSGNSKTFMFKKIEDFAVESYFEILFDTVDSKSEEEVFNKALVYIKKGASLVYKIIEFNAKGERLETITMNDLEMKDPSTYKMLNKAIEKMAAYVDTVVKPEL